ncbi:MAG: tetratricopeptide repeat-containing sulfotransferase family protein [Rhodanobacteraceae bacterium]
MSRSVERHWERGRGYLQQRQLAAAWAQLESLRALAPQDVRTRLLSAHVAWHEDHIRDAAARALDAADSASEDADLLCEVVDTLLQVGETAAAHRLLDHPAWQLASSTEALLRYANYRQDFGEQVQALAVLDRLSPKQDASGPFHFYRGQQLAFLGRSEEAEAEYETCLALAPDYGRAAYRMVRLRQQTPANHCLEVVEAGLRQSRLDARAHAAFGFARYHVLEDLGRHEEAWDALSHANLGMYPLSWRDAAQQQLMVQRLADWFATHPIAKRTHTFDGPCPIFIIGMPRSGTTLLQHMLSNHSQVTAGGELVDFGQQLLRVADTRSIAGDVFLSRLSALDLADVGRRYLAQTAWRACGNAYFVDKQPANWMVAGLIHAALPQAKILHLVREPMDVCFSNFRVMFGDANNWSYDFATLAEHYNGYRRMLRYWHAMLPGAILDVPYADLVRAPGTTLRRVFSFCELEWQDGCEDVTRNTASVSSLSSAQVREPVHTRGLEVWQPYAAQLEPLQRALRMPG